MEKPLDDWEIKKIRQLICPHRNTENFIETWATDAYPCEHCMSYDKKCNDCNSVVRHKCCCEYNCVCDDDD